MVFIELYKPRATHMKYIEGKRKFLNRKRLSYFISQEIPDFFSYHKYSNMQSYIRRCFIICMCKILVQNFIIKGTLKKKKRCSLNFCTDYSFTLIYTKPGALNQYVQVKLTACHVYLSCAEFSSIYIKLSVSTGKS